MKSSLFLAAAVAFAIPASHADENHDIIAKVMKEGLKGDDSPLEKVLGGSATDEEKTEFAELMATMKGTKTPKGDQAAYDEKVEALIKAAHAAVVKDAPPAALDALETAANCKACHKDHKPKKE